MSSIPLHHRGLISSQWTFQNIIKRSYGFRDFFKNSDFISVLFMSQPDRFHMAPKRVLQESKTATQRIMNPFNNQNYSIAPLRPFFFREMTDYSSGMIQHPGFGQFGEKIEIINYDENHEYDEITDNEEKKSLFESLPIFLSSTLKKRRAKMNKHKLRKRRKKERRKTK